MSGSILKRLLKRYNSGSASRAERYIVDIWYSSFEDLGDKTPGLETENEAEETKGRMFNNIHAYTQQPAKLWYQSVIFRVACVFFIISTGILLVINTSILSQDPQIYQTAKGEIKTILLADSTKVWLNGNSRLQVLPRYAEKDRKIELIGEAYFEVTHNPQKPFIVTSGELQTQVLGTTFNISAYPKLNNITIAVNTGKVAVSRDREPVATLLPHHTVQYNTLTQQADRRVIDTNELTSWRNGRVTLEDASFEELAVKFDNMFDVRLYSKDNTMAELRFRLVIDRTLSVEENLKIITGIHQLKFKKTAENEIEIYK